MATVREQKQERLREVEVSIRVLTQFVADYKSDLGELRSERSRIKRDLKRLETEPEKMDYILRVETEHFNVDDRWVEDVTEQIRGYAFPKAWRLEGRGSGKPPVFWVEFEVEANERSHCEYLDEVRNALLNVDVGPMNSTIEEVR